MKMQDLSRRAGSSTRVECAGDAQVADAELIRTPFFWGKTLLDFALWVKDKLTPPRCGHPFFSVMGQNPINSNALRSRGLNINRTESGNRVNNRYSECSQRQQLYNLLILNDYLLFPPLFSLQL
jgi:hypothetical protein